MNEGSRKSDLAGGVADPESPAQETSQAKEVPGIGAVAGPVEVIHDGLPVLGAQVSQDRQLLLDLLSVPARDRGGLTKSV